MVSPVLSPEGQRFPSPSGHTISDADQDDIGLIGLVGTQIIAEQGDVNLRVCLFICHMGKYP